MYALLYKFIRREVSEPYKLSANCPSSVQKCFYVFVLPYQRWSVISINDCFLRRVEDE